MTSLQHSIVSLTHPLIAKRAPKLPTIPDLIPIGLDERFVIVGEHNGKFDLRFLKRGKAKLGIDYGLLNVPKDWVVAVEPLVRYKECPKCHKQRSQSTFRQGRAECSVCVSQRRIKRPHPRKKA